jgi:hypothetical protein
MLFAQEEKKCRRNLTPKTNTHKRKVKGGCNSLSPHFQYRFLYRDLVFQKKPRRNPIPKQTNLNRMTAPPTH